MYLDIYSLSIKFSKAFGSIFKKRRRISGRCGETENHSRLKHNDISAYLVNNNSECILIIRHPLVMTHSEKIPPKQVDRLPIYRLLETFGINLPLNKKLCERE